MYTKNKSLRIVFLIYLVAFLVGAFLTIFLDDQTDLLSKLFFIDIVLTGLVFAFSLRFGNASIYDPYWSIMPFFMLFYWGYYSYIDFWTPQIFLTCFVVTAYSFRLTYNWTRRWRGMDDQDWRYSMLAGKTGKWYPMVNFLGIHLFPTLMVFVVTIPLYYLFMTVHEFTWLNYAGVGVAMFGIWIEWLADYQLFRFKVMHNNPIAVMRFGIWKYIRHPNYLGEISFWFGLAMMAMGFFRSWELLLGPLLMTAMFALISIPMMQKHLIGRKPGYDDYIKSSWKLIPYVF